MRTALLAALLTAGCGADQWVVHVSTDAPVPQLGDRVYIEILDGTTVLETRLVGTADAAQWPISFGLVPGGAARPRVRARLFPAALAGRAGLPARAYLDASGRLPAPSGRTEVALHLPILCFGVAGGDDTTCDPATGRPGPEPELARVLPEQLPRPGESPYAAEAPCTGSATESTVCIPGGLLVLGNAAANPLRNDSLGAPLRLVQVRPFYIDREEMVVRTYRDLSERRKQRTGQGLVEPILRTLGAGCTYDRAPGPMDEYPVNCVRGADAEAVCAERGMRLPTEVEWEYAAGNLGQETPFPWGGEEDVCARAVVSRGRGIWEIEEEPESLECRIVAGGQVLPWGAIPRGLPERAGGRPADETLRGVRDLTGNVAEVVRDRFASYEERCWAPRDKTLLVDWTCPLPDSPSEEDERVVRGGSWVHPPDSVEVTRRYWLAAENVSPAIGLRCVQAPPPRPEALP